MTFRANMPTPVEFEAFLYAEIGTEDNGMVLTVASAFARLGLDPWHQAAVLARLSDVAATASLAALIGRLQSSVSAGAPAVQTEAIASRLVPLLPRETAAASAALGDAPKGRRARGAAAAPPARGGSLIWLFWGIIAAAGLYMVWF